jgi:tetratricopeptide (TPR) repeat protein
MKWQLHLRRTTAVALVVGFCLLLSSCVSHRPRQALSDSSRQFEGAALNATEVDKAKALAHFATGISLELREGSAAALPEYLRAYELDPTETNLGLRAAQIYASQKEFTNAVAILETVIRNDPKSPDPWFWLGVVYRASEETAKAISAFQRSLQLDAGQLISLQSLLDLQIQQPAANTDVFSCLKKAKQVPSTEWQYWFRLGELCAEAIKQKPSFESSIGSDTALRCFEKAYTYSASEPRVLARLAASYEENNLYAKAAMLYARLLELEPDLPQLRDRLAYTYVHSDQPAKAIETYTAILKEEPLRYDVYNSLAEVYEEIENDSAAISAYQQSLAINSNQIAPSIRIALLQSKMKQYDAALKTLSDAKAKHPVAYQLPYLIALVYSDQKDYEKALSAFAEAQTLVDALQDTQKPDASFYFSYGCAAERAGNIDKAASLFHKAIELAPERPDAYNYLGYMWADKGVHLEESLALIQKAVALDPDNAAYLDSLGWVLYKLNRPAEALPHLQRAVSLMAKETTKTHEEDATLLDHLADVLAKLGKKEAAVAALRRAIKAEPGNKVIAEKLEQLTGKKDH